MRQIQDALRKERPTTEKARRKPRFFCCLFTVCAVFTLHTAQAACDFAAAKKEIDQVLDQDKEKSASFRKQMAAGYDSLDVLGKMLPADAREKVEQCRFEAGEYLTKRGFPPAH